MSGPDARHMAHALALARRGQGRCWPNPAVGCVIVRDGRIVGRGRTMPGGRPHAEQVALAQAGAAARGAAAYVSLEPCAHHGRTPPCAAALIEAGVARVVAPMEDPDPRVSGRGFAMLREAGIAVETGPLRAAAARGVEGFATRIREGRPKVSLKLAASLDGRIATADGASRWITGAAARRRTHALRARHDAVMIGAGTARADDPTLTARDLGLDWQPVRVVLCTRLDLPADSALARTAEQAPLWLCHGPQAPEARIAAWRGAGARLVRCAEAGPGLDVRSALEALGAEGLTSVLCEGGGALAAALLSADLVDEMFGFTAGIAIGAEGVAGVGDLGLASLDAAARFELAGVERIGADALHRWRRACPASRRSSG